MASNYIDPRAAKMAAREAAREIDYRYVRFNLEIAEGQQSYLAYIQEHPCDPQFFGSDLASHQRQQIFDEKHYWYAEAIVRKVLGLGEPGPWKRGDRIGRPDHVELFV